MAIGLGPLFWAVRSEALYRMGAGVLAVVLSVSALTDVAVPRPLHGVRIAVDAGHGGEDRGVCHFAEGLIEKEINLDMAFRLARALEQGGADVLMTRSDDTFIPLSERAARANSNKADLFISLHANRIPGHPDCFGAQTFYFPGSVEGERLAKAIQAELLAIDPENYRQAMPGRFAVLRQSDMPSALVEIAFMTNDRDRRLLQEEEYRVRVTQAIVAGIERYLAESETRNAD